MTQITLKTDSPLARAQSWADSLLKDHGLLRLAYDNWAEVAPGVYRSAQPSPARLARAKQDGLKTVINLRGVRNCGSYVLEREACARLGLTLIDAPLESRGAPQPDRIHRAARLFAEVEYPLLFHCKSGADRAGLMAGLYVLLRTARPPEAALDQLSLRFLHIKAGKTGILDAFFAAYIAAYHRSGIGFLDWVDTEYDRDALKAGFTPEPLGNFLVERLLRRE